MSRCVVAAVGDQVARCDEQRLHRYIREFKRDGPNSAHSRESGNPAISSRDLFSWQKLGPRVRGDERTSSRTNGRTRTVYIFPMRPQDILMPTPAGLFCKPGGFYIDPVRAVNKALITHGHSDHARVGHRAVL